MNNSNKSSANNIKHLKIASQMLRLINSFLVINGTKVPSLDGLQFAVTEIILSKDLSISKVYIYSYSNQNEMPFIVSELNKNHFDIKKYLASHLSIKNMPSLRFLVDKSIDQGNRIEELLQEVKTK